MPNHLTAVILAAGKGTRMKSPKPKVLCEVLFKPMLRWTVDACLKAGITDIVIVAGEDKESLESLCPECTFVCQQERLGTGHALMMAKPCFHGGQILVLNGDGPFITPETIQGALQQHLQEKNAVTLVSAILEDPTGYGRVIRENPIYIVEERDTSEEQRAIREVNSGVYWMDADFLETALVPETFQTGNAQKEYYLTDMVGAAGKAGKKAGAFPCLDSNEILGANDRKTLTRLNAIAKTRIIEKHLDNGVDIPFFDGVVIGPDVEIEPGASILPGTLLLGHTRIGAGCEIGPNSRLEDAEIGENSKIKASWLTRCTVGRNCTVGPFAQFRPGVHLKDGVKVGDFVELKNAAVGNGTSIAHLTYLGDCTIGEKCNFGCGVVTANYDGKQKYQTIVGDRAFIGCNTNLIPPVSVGDGAYTAAGTTVDQDVPEGALAIGRSRQEIKENWADEHIAFKKG